MQVHLLSCISSWNVPIYSHKIALISRQLSRTCPAFHCDCLKHVCNSTLFHSRRNLFPSFPYKESITPHLEEAVWDVATGMALKGSLALSITKTVTASKTLHRNWKLEMLLNKYHKSSKEKEGLSHRKLMWVIMGVCKSSIVRVIPLPWCHGASCSLISPQKDIDYQWHPWKC